MTHSNPHPIVVDTDVLSFSFKEDTRADFYRPYLSGHQVIISFMTVAELGFWAHVHGWGATRREQLRRFLQPFTIIDSNEELCEWWSVICAGARRLGRPISAPDAWIAATALQFSVPLVTHNPSDFSNVPGLDIRTASRP